MINPLTAWQHISAQARKAMDTQMLYHSLVEKRAYKVLSVEKTKITMARLSGGNDGALTKASVEKAIEKFNANGYKPCADEH